jgi:hypothetical protein
MEESGVSPQAVGRDRHECWAVLAVTVVVFCGLLLLLANTPNLYDSDSYYHLAVARKYADEGLRGGLPWARQSVMAKGFGDKELLFHLLLIPFVKLGGTTGGKLAIAMLVALLAAQISRLSVRATGPWGALVPLWLLLTAVDFPNRLLRLRPETLSCLLLLVTVELAVTRRYRLLGLVALLFTYSHTAWQTLPVLCLLWLLQLGLSERRWEWHLLAYPLLGCGLALILHPQFPHNLLVWWVQNVDRYRISLPDAGGEFGPNELRTALEVNAGWWLGLWFLWRAAKPAADASEPEQRLAGFLGLATVGFGILFAIMSRFATYFMPIGTLALLFELRRRGLRVSRHIALPIRGHLPLLVGFASLALLLPANVADIRATLYRAGALRPGREALGEAFGRVVPSGARVATTWAETEFYVYWAPHARYLNVLDPGFMALRNRRNYSTSLAVFAGSEPDVPLKVATDLDSDYVALFMAEQRPVGLRLAADPRVKWSHRNLDNLFAILPDANRAFGLDWMTAPMAPTSGAPEAPMTIYPRADSERARATEGFVDFRRLPPGPSCRVFAHDVAIPKDVELTYEFAPYGSGSLSIDGRLLVDIGSPLRAVLGRGASLPVRLNAGSHTFTVRTCVEGEYGGFYLLERDRRPRTP